MLPSKHVCKIKKSRVYQAENREFLLCPYSWLVQQVCRQLKLGGVIKTLSFCAYVLLANKIKSLFSLCYRGMHWLKPGAIIGDGDRKRGVHAAPSKKTNVLFLEKIAPPSTS